MIHQSKRLFSTGRKGSEYNVYECEGCKKDFVRMASEAKRSIHLFCTVKCFYANREHWSKREKNSEAFSKLKKKASEYIKLHPISPKGSESAKIVSQKAKKRMEDVEYKKWCLENLRRGRLKFDHPSFIINTDIEKLLKIEMDNRNIDYQRNKHMLGGATYPDFFIQPNICVYADGDYWHGTKEAKEKDSQQTYALKTRGYEVVRLKGSEIHKDVKACVNFIELHMENR